MAGRDGELRLKYYIERDDVVVDAGPFRESEDWYAAWLNSMVNTDADVIFFVIRINWSTDMWPEEINFNNDEDIKRFVKNRIPVSIYSRIKLNKEDL